jgi:hypothetical protein
MSFLHCERREFAIVPLMLLVGLASSPAQPSQSTPYGVHGGSSLPAREQAGDSLLSPDLRSRNLQALPAEIVVQRMMMTSARRSSQLHGFRTTRTYHLQYHGLLGSRDADMKVVATYTAPDKLEFSVVSQHGSKLLLNRVLLKLLDGERDAFHDQSQVELSPKNYTFDSQGIERTEQNNPSYVLDVSPRKQNKFLYRGKVWIDANDFALAHMEGQPAKSPSFWIKDTHIDSTWAKVGEFWMVQRTQSVSHIRMGGQATLTIDYSDYQITGAGRPQGRGQTPQLPDPSLVSPQQ